MYYAIVDRTPYSYTFFDDAAQAAAQASAEDGSGSDSD